jgi:hypothetical protein
MNKVLGLILVICFSLIIVGCGAPEQEQTFAPSTAPVTVSEKTIPTAEQAEIKPAEPEKWLLDSKITTVIDKADSVTSVEYDYYKFVKGASSKESMHALLKGTKMKQKLPRRAGTFTKETDYDTIYIDMSQKTATAYCESVKTCNDITNKVELNYDSLLLDSPLDLLKTITDAKLVGSEMREGYDAIKLEDIYNGKNRRIWLYTYTGLPSRYEYYDPETTEVLGAVEYLNYITNRVKDSDFVPLQP